jgi:DNA-binding PadR family transcriptional regulator
MHNRDNHMAKHLRMARSHLRHAWGGHGRDRDALRAGKMLADGDLRLIVLALLAEGPRHGYDIIKAVEERSSGVYSPSPGVIYPTLTYLEEAGQATAASQGNKRVYTITEAGQSHLAANRAAIDAVLARIDGIGRRFARARAWSDWTDEAGDKPAVAELDRARRRLRMLIADAIESGEDGQRRLADILNRAADEALRQV